MQNAKLVEALNDLKAFDRVEVIVHETGTPDIELTIPSKCVFFALVHLNHDCSVNVAYKNYHHDEHYDIDAYAMDNGLHDYSIDAGTFDTPRELAQEIAFNAEMIA